MSQPLGVSPTITTLQITSTAVPQSLDSAGSWITKRILLAASAAAIYVGGAGVSTANGFPIPVVPAGGNFAYLELWVHDPQKLWVVGAGTVYVLFERPESVQT